MAPKENELVPERSPLPIENNKKGILKSSKRLPKMSPKNVKDVKKHLGRLFVRSQKTKFPTNCFFVSLWL